MVALKKGKGGGMVREGRRWNGERGKEVER